ncbi:MAG: hypothetical protein MJ071_07990 [Oscillospiraceae bacterium]|nr:hypothetical protein [Oscillospiraceae bacterium]
MYQMIGAWEPMHFFENLKYMGIGMLGIFIVIGVIVALTLFLNAVTGSNKTSGKNER